jgi:zinc transport system substrate-binding protein
VWLDPVLVRSLAGRICQALIQIDPNHAGEYRQRRDDYQKRLDLLHGTIEETVTGFRIKEYVTFHPAWSYFSRRYGLEEVGVIQESPGRDPTPRQIEKIVRAIEAYHIEAVFAEPQHNPAAAEAIAQEAGVRVLILDPLGGADVPGRDSYIALMEYNVAIMKEAMR